MRRNFNLNKDEINLLKTQGFINFDFILPSAPVVVLTHRGRFYFKEYTPTQKNLDKFTRLRKCTINGGKTLKKLPLKPMKPHWLDKFL